MQGQRGMAYWNELQEYLDEQFITERRRERFSEEFQYVDRLRQLIYVGQSVGELAGPEELALVRACYDNWIVELPLKLLKKRVALYGITLTAENSLNAYVSSPEQKMLNQFATIVLRPSQDIFRFTPPYHLKIQKEFFSSENYRDFAEFLTFQENTLGLVKISMAIPINGGSMDFGLPPFSLPTMRELRILFSDQGTTGHSFGSNDNFVPFLQLILDGANELERLEFIYSQNNTIPTQLQNLTFPKSLKSLYLECELTSQQLEPLTVCDLPNLRDFGVRISTHTWMNNLLGRVLDRFKSTLKRLYFRGIGYRQSCIPRVGHVSYFRFPVMESLKSFVNFTILGELEDGQSRLETVLPNVYHLVLKRQTREMLQKWIQSSRFPTVTKLGVGLVDENVSEDRMGHHISVTEQEMQFVLCAFRNVTVLAINVTDDLSGLRCLLLSGTLPLAELKIVVKKFFWYTNSNRWDSLLVGVSQFGGIDLLRENPHMLDDPNVYCNTTSIRKFTALKFLTLAAHFVPGIDIEDHESLITDTSFEFAFLKMPNLTKLHFAGRFVPTPEATRRWKLQQRSISYTTNC